MDPSSSSFSPRNLTGAEAHSEDPDHIADNLCRFASGGFDGMAWSSGYQHHGPQMKAAPIDIPFERTVPYPLSMPLSSSSAPLEEQHRTHRGYATTHDQYAGHELPVVCNVYQGFMDDGYDHCSQPSLGEQWPIIPGDEFLVNLEQDATTYWDPYSVAGHQPLLATGSDVMMDIIPTAQTPNGGPLVFRCQHHTGNGPCGILLDGVPHALEHFSDIHVQPMFMTSESPWICRWGGECDTHLRKGNWRRHVIGHLIRWGCSNCPQTYSRNDTARKHAKHCGGNGHIFMVPTRRSSSMNI